MSAVENDFATVEFGGQPTLGHHSYSDDQQFNENVRAGCYANYARTGAKGRKSIQVG